MKGVKLSLYNDVAQKLKNSGLIGTATSSINGSISSVVGGLVGNGMIANAIGDRVISAGEIASKNLVNKYMPTDLVNKLEYGGSVAGSILSGDFSGAALKVVDHEWSSMFGGGSNSGKLSSDTPLFGGISANEAKKIMMESLNTKYAKKNLFMVEVSSKLEGDASSKFNLFCLDLDYTPFIVTGEKRKLGSATSDSVQSSEAVEFRMTTLDDERGGIRRWFAAHHAMTVHQDGTVGVPADYAIKIKVLHGIVEKNGKGWAYFDVGNFRPATLEVALSRREDALQEIQMTFSQLDTFMTVS
jgi:hypothetical protein